MLKSNRCASIGHSADRSSQLGWSVTVTRLSPGRSISKAYRDGRGAKRQGLLTTPARTTTSVHTRGSPIGLRRRCTIQVARTNPLSVREQATTEARQQNSTLILSLYCPKHGVHLNMSSPTSTRVARYIRPLPRPAARPISMTPMMIWINLNVTFFSRRLPMNAPAKAHSVVTASSGRFSPIPVWAKCAP